MNLKKVAPENIIGKCSWCGRTMPAGLPVFVIGGKSRGEVNFSDQAGKWIQITVGKEQRRLPAMVPVAGSQAARSGYDMMFISCTEQCGNEMRVALEKEISQGGTVLEGVKNLGR